MSYEGNLARCQRRTVGIRRTKDRRVLSASASEAQSQHVGCVTQGCSRTSAVVGRCDGFGESNLLIKSRAFSESDPHGSTLQNREALRKAKPCSVVASFWKGGRRMSMINRVQPRRH